MDFSSTAKFRFCTNQRVPLISLTLYFWPSRPSTKISNTGQRVANSFSARIESTAGCHDVQNRKSSPPGSAVESALCLSAQRATYAISTISESGMESALAFNFMSFEYFSAVVFCVFQ